MAVKLSSMLGWERARRSSAWSRTPALLGDRDAGPAWFRDWCRAGKVPPNFFLGGEERAAASPPPAVTAAAGALPSDGDAVLLLLPVAAAGRDMRMATELVRWWVYDGLLARELLVAVELMVMTLQGLDLAGRSGPLSGSWLSLFVRGASGNAAGECCGRYSSGTGEPAPAWASHSSSLK
jgi:hypothetical protein